MKEKLQGKSPSANGGSVERLDTPIKALVGSCYHREQSGGEWYQHSPRNEQYQRVS